MSSSTSARNSDHEPDDEEQDLGLGLSLSPTTSTSVPGPAARRTLQPKRALRLYPELKLGLGSSPSSPDLQRPVDLLRRSPLSPLLSPIHSRSRTLPGSYFKSIDYSLEPAPLTAEEVVKIQRWILCVAVVNFDLDVGPMLHHVYPPVEFSEKQRENIAFSAFPDSASFTTGSDSHSFRIRDPPSASHNHPPSIDGYLYGFALFMQKRDPQMRRGYLQKSIVFLSHHPHVSLFLETASKLGPAYFKHGSPLLETACRNIAGWPDPKPGVTLELGFLGLVLKTELPAFGEEQQSVETASFTDVFKPHTHILASIPPSPPVEVFSAAIASLWSIWECVILGEPILIYASNARICSDAVWWLRDLIRPIPLAGDFRPFFTIHDTDFRTLVTKKHPAAGLILGVTNPFFETACKHWPHILSLTKDGRNGNGHNDMPTQGTLLGPSPGWHSKHKRYISKDRALLKTLEDGIRARNYDECSRLLRIHFLQQTEKLLVPLNRYFGSLIPTDAYVISFQSASSTPLTLKPFNTPHFMASLKTHGSPLKFRVQGGGQRDFYEHFLRCSNFGSWLRTRADLAQREMDKMTAART
ncbi:DUF1630-domain-containing protein [Dacryopinax primogenitus]|uniref:DUF1630-domain-containing protein n=1 Tax=Dacryopinax primogenitus (strain DJM 731) TaxID=1858805 RepID=M5GG78_DACPD|nr:DUF1630-domain-containing protein [Dacryopinax primogenitus]EJU05013.1 DUF1630-domain-containing protein [Dacryopinax primogenitus]